MSKSVSAILILVLVCVIIIAGIAKVKTRKYDYF